MKKLILIFTLFSNSILSAYSQYCIPSADCSFDDYIDNFSFATITNNNTGGSNCNSTSYVYYSSLSTTVTAGNTYNVSMQSGPDWEEGFGVWIDFNQDGDFDDASEFVFASTNATTMPVNGTISIPSSASNGLTRMRIRCKYAQTISANESCTDFPYGETEDYNIYIINNIPPVAGFSSSASSCSPTISFTDESQYATSWLWDFGDGSTSTQQNPVHSYASPGNYTVTLMVSNAYGTDSFSAIVTASGSSTATPIPAQCTPQTLDNTMGFGITQVQFNTIYNATLNSSAGYEDFTCLQTNVFLGYSYPLSIILDNTAEQNVKVWIDYNNDGSFNETTELVASANQVFQLDDTISIPAAAVTNQPLRMRIASDYYLYGPFTSCDDMNVGQAEDYTVVIQENTNPPIANFDVSPPKSCDGNVQFIDQSLNIPTAYYWDFDDGNTSTAPNPTHTYLNSGIYNVTLTVTNAYGSDSYTKAVTVDYGGNLPPADCTPHTTAHCCGYGISRVLFGMIDHPSGNGSESYQDYSCSYNTTLEAGTQVHYEIRTGSSNPEDIKVWIDLNNDGAFDDNTELIIASYNKTLHSGNICVPSTDSLNIPLRMRVMSDYVGASLTPCYTPQWGQTEDYAITILPNQNGIFADFESDNTSSCNGIVNFTAVVCDNNAQFLWDFGDGSTSSAASPTHTYISPGTYDVILNVTTSAGTVTIVKNGYYTKEGIFGVPNPSCTPVNLLSYPEVGIGYVEFADIAHYSNFSDVEGTYVDNSCSRQTAVLSGQSYPITVFTGNAYDHSVSVWLDYNANSILEPSELAVTTLSGTGYQNGTINIPSISVTTDQPLLMRVGAITDATLLTEPCNAPFTYGQFEDYTVYILDDSSLPVANFTVDSNYVCNGIVKFTDLSSGNPTSWLWDFGDGTTSTQQNPVHAYSNYGYYDVSLTVTNANGSDVLSYSSYIYYDSTACLNSFSPTVLNNPLNVYPNPFRQSLSIANLNSFINARLIITDIIGKKIFEAPINKNQYEINTEAWEKGIYMLFIKHNDYQHAVKLIKQ